jgi:hypothetical protein
MRCLAPERSARPARETAACERAHARKQAQIEHRRCSTAPGIILSPRGSSSRVQEFIAASLAFKSGVAGAQAL